MEQWKDIEGYEGLYQVSNLGNVRSLKFSGGNKAKLLKQNITKEGYKRVGLCKNGKRKDYRIHRLVAMAFIPNPNNLPIINHKDEDKGNNNVNNLEWCTIAYNNTYGTARERAGKNISKSVRGENNSNYGKKGKDASASKPIFMYDEEGNFIRQFDSISETNEYFGKKFAYSTVSACLRGRYKTAYGFVFKYVEENN